MAANTPAWDALVKATAANPHMESTTLGIALLAIRKAHKADGLLEEDLPAEIERRAALYRSMWPHLTLTPIALAKHWYRVLPQQSVMDKWKERFGDE